MTIPIRRRLAIFFDAFQNNWDESANPVGSSVPGRQAMDFEHVDRRFRRLLCTRSVYARPDPCTPEQAVVESKGDGQYHVYRPANLEWGASVPNPAGAPARVWNVKGIVCWEPQLRKTSGCNGPPGNGVIPGTDPEGGENFIAPQQPAGSLVVRTLNGRIWFSVNDPHQQRVQGQRGIL